MRFHRTLPVMLLAFLFVNSAAYAQPLTREEVRSLAVSQSKTLQKALLSVNSAQLAEKIQAYNFWPSVSANAGASLGYPETGLRTALGASAGLTVSQTLYSGGKLSTLSTINALATRAAREEARAVYFSALQQADEAFSGVLEALSSVEAAQSDLETARMHQSLAEAQLEAGIIARSAYLMTEAETASAETALIQAQGKLSVAYAKLSSLTGLPLPLALENTEASATAALMDKLAGFSEAQTTSLIAGVQKAAFANNPSLGKANLAREQARSYLALAKTDYLPSLSATWSNSVMYSTGLGAGGGSLSIGASIPLNFWVTKANAETKDIAARQADLESEEARRGLELDIQATVYSLIWTARASSSSRKALEYAESHYQDVLERYKLSAASSYELSDAEALVSTSRNQLISAGSQFFSSFSILRTLAGLESDELLLRIIP